MTGPGSLATWALLAVEHDDEYHSLTEYIQLPGGVLFRETFTAPGGVASVALTFASGLELEDPADADGPRLTRAR